MAMTPTEQNILKEIVKILAEYKYSDLEPISAEQTANKILQLAQKETAEKVERLKEEWRTKAKRMTIMSDEVAIFELEHLLEKIFSEDTK
jgi:tripartite-type tricarboxylate transporter receptor subunit TctC